MFYYDKDDREMWFFGKGNQLNQLPNIEINMPPIKTSTRELGASGWSVKIRQRHWGIKSRSRVKVNIYPDDRSSGFNFHFTSDPIYTLDSLCNALIFFQENGNGFNFGAKTIVIEKETTKIIKENLKLSHIEMLDIVAKETYDKIKHYTTSGDDNDDVAKSLAV